VRVALISRIFRGGLENRELDHSGQIKLDREAMVLKGGIYLASAESAWFFIMR
jgi:hypothetical protein